ncbi:hypothetical protein AcW1_002660 [Taiwanofungus camphoratus]|nr:hypothetical protein AcV5_009659 [Antrodia cinnamomea]KAI0942890.1 hypothetical protein AcV7_002183 [Antrodia cinnamomea]KAI0943511.1 hypothetical protein AcW1_002660 [Antrodia cinnamomea]
MWLPEENQSDSVRDGSRRTVQDASPSLYGQMDRILLCNVPLPPSPPSSVLESPSPSPASFWPQSVPLAVSPSRPLESSHSLSPLIPLSVSSPLQISSPSSQPLSMHLSWPQTALALNRDIALPSRSVLPIEVWEDIIDHVASAMWWRRHTLLACALTCHAWYPRSLVNLVRRVVLSRRSQLNGFSKLITSKPCLGDHIEEIYVDSVDPQRDAASVLASFPAQLARRARRVERLQFGNVDWCLAPLHPKYFYVLAEFASVTQLRLVATKFHSLGQFGRLICSLPNLSILRMSALQLLEGQYNLGSSQQFVSHLRLTSLMIDGPQAGWVGEVFGWFNAVTKGTLYLEEIVLRVNGDPECIELRDAESVGIGSLCAAAGASLRCLQLGIKVETLVFGLEESENIARRYLDLSKNTHLRSLALTVNFSSRTDNMRWVSAMLSHVISHNMRDITVRLWMPYDLYEGMEDGDESEAIQHRTQRNTELLGRLPLEHIDTILSRGNFVTLSNVTLRMGIHEPNANEIEWVRPLESGLSKVNARGILQISFGW